VNPSPSERDVIYGRPHGATKQFSNNR